MSAFSEIVVAILPLFILMGLGVLVRRSGLLERDASTLLSSFVLDIALPALILVTLLTSRLELSYAALPVAMWAAQFVAIGLVLLALRAVQLKRSSQGAMLFGIFGNTSFIGYPLTNALLPGLLPATVIIDQIGMTLMMFAAVPVISARYGDLDEAERLRRASQTPGQRLLEQAKSPLLLSLVVGLAARGLLALTGRSDQLLASRPALIILDTLHLLGGAAIPVVMIALGMRLSAGSLRRHLPAVGLIGAVKLIFMPVLAYAASRFVFHLHGHLLSVSALEAAVPTATTTMVFAVRYRLDSDLAVALVFGLTVASAVTVPVMLTMLR